jgi:hypothetical protein
LREKRRRYLAAAKVSLEFEQIQNLIFGSQIYLLKKLNEIAGQDLSPAELQLHYEHVQKMFSEQFSDWSLEKYLHFLFARSLVVLQDGRYHITNLGKEYLVWIARTGRTENKAF